MLPFFLGSIDYRNCTAASSCDHDFLFGDARFGLLVKIFVFLRGTFSAPRE